VRSVWTRRFLFFAAGLVLFLLVRWGWGEEGVQAGRIATIVVLAVGFAVLVVLLIAARRRGSTGAGALAKLLRAGRVDEAVRKGRELFEGSPNDTYVAWYYTAALMASGHMAEARRVFATLNRHELPPKMADLHDEVRQALEKRSQGS
jgi:hypothetical protein